MGGEHEHSSFSIDDLKILSIFVIFLAGLIGAAAPVAFTYCFISQDDDKETRKSKERRINLIIKVLTCISLGIILATALIHLIPHGVSELQESGNHLFAEPHEDAAHEEAHSDNETADEHAAHSEEEHEHAYPFAYLFAMVSLVAVFFISTEINWWGVRRIKELKGVSCDEKEESRLAASIKLWVTEIGIFVHSIIIGITLGVTKTESLARTLVIVLVVHQLFEGLSVGTLTIAAQCNKLQAAFFVLLFAVGVPIGVAIGIGIEDNTDKVATGVLLCLSGGILIFVSCVEMLPHLFGSHHHHAHGPIPVAEIHDHIHGNPLHDHHHHDHDHDHEHEKSEQQKEGETTVPVPSPPDSSSPNTTTPQVTDEHHDEDESFGFRIVCYIAIIFGCSIQSVLGIWA
jgi:zinc transporter ZupT